MRSGRLLFVPLTAWLGHAAPSTAQTAPPRIDAGVATRTATEQRPVEAPAPTTEIESPGDASPTPLDQRVMVGAIRVRGGENLPSDRIMAAIAPFVGHKLSASDLQDLLTAVSGVARAEGYIFARSSIPAQALSAGVLVVHLYEGRIDEVRQTGASSDAVAAILGSLIGHAPKRSEVERKMMLAGDLPGVAIGKVHFAFEEGRGVLIVPVTHDRFSGQAEFDNRGLQALGPERARLAGAVNGLLSDRDSLAVQGIATPLQPKELLVLGARYALQPNLAGTELAAYGTYGETHPGGLWQGRLNGESGSLGVSLTQPLERTQNTSLWLTTQADRIVVDEWWDDAISQRDVVTTVGASLNGYRAMAGGRLRAGAGITKSISLLGATSPSNPLASRPNSGSEFTLITAWANWQGSLGGPFSLRVATTSQLSSDPLPSVEQLTIGGPFFGRGYNFSERSGDKGVLASAELRDDVLNRNAGDVRWVQLYTFGDAGYVTSHENDYGSGALFSAGAGVRIGFDSKLQLALESAWPLNQLRYDSGDRSPRLSAALSASF